jgi:hypothetical protein
LLHFANWIKGLVHMRQWQLSSPALIPPPAAPPPDERRFASRLRRFLEDDYLIWYDVQVGPRP